MSAYIYFLSCLKDYIMKFNESLISSLGVEDIKLHKFKLSNKSYTIATELSAYTFFGYSCNDERNYCIHNKHALSIARHRTDDSKFNELFDKIINSTLKSTENNKCGLANMENDGLAFFVMYYALTEYRNLTLHDEFNNVKPLFQSHLDDIILIGKYVSNVAEESPYGALFRPISNSDIVNTESITSELWKEIYANQLLQAYGRNYVSEWLIASCITKNVFTSDSNIKKAIDGGKIKFIQDSVILQERAAIESLRSLIDKLKRETFSLDFTCDNLSVMMIYKLDYQVVSENLSRLSDYEFLCTITQSYIQLVSTLLCVGMIHNDPALENICFRNDYVILRDYRNAILSDEHVTDKRIFTMIKDNMSTLLKQDVSHVKHATLFSAYAAYDIIRFVFVVKQHIDSSHLKHHTMLDEVISKCLRKIRFIPKQEQLSPNWIDIEFNINPLERDQTLLFISSRRKHAIRQRNEFIVKTARRYQN